MIMINANAEFTATSTKDIPKVGSWFVLFCFDGEARSQHLDIPF